MRKKIEKLKQDISSAEDYQKLQKCSSKLEKIQSNVGTLMEKKSRKELRGWVEMLQAMIKEKTKVFKKKVLYQLNCPSGLEN